MKSIAVAVCVVFASTAFALGQRIDPASVKMEQKIGSEVATIEYMLQDSPGIVTVDIQTNAGDNVWLSIGDRNLKGFTGDVNKLVTTVGTPVTMGWHPELFWPGQDIRGGKVRAVVKAWATNNPPDYAVFDLTVPGSMMFYTSEDALPHPITNDLYKTECLVVRRMHAAGIPWRRGSPSSESGKRSGIGIEDPFLCTLSDDYYIGVYEFTDAQYSYVNGTIPSGDGVRKPKVPVSWNNCRGDGASGADYDWPLKGHAVAENSIFGNLRRVTGQAFDLPTASQWEFACRAGCTAAFSDGTQGWADYEAVNRIGWFSSNATDAHAVGLLSPNAWGLYDMHGNASEWVLDYASAFPQNYNYETGPETPPMDHSWIPGAHRLIKGGGFQETPQFARSGAVADWSRSSGMSDHPLQIGMRVCMPAVISY